MADTTITGPFPFTPAVEIDNQPIPKPGPTDEQRQIMAEEYSSITDANIPDTLRMMAEARRNAC